MTNIFSDQDYAEMQTVLDHLVEQVRASAARKRERHGEKFDTTKAAQDFIVLADRLPDKIRSVLLGTALFRLAEGDLFAEIADLDFDFHPEEKDQMTTTTKYVFTITAPGQDEVSKVLINILDQADKVDLGFDYHVSITDQE